MDRSTDSNEQERSQSLVGQVGRVGKPSAGTAGNSLLYKCLANLATISFDSQE